MNSYLYKYSHDKLHKIEDSHFTWGLSPDSDPFVNDFKEVIKTVTELSVQILLHSEENTTQICK